MRLISPISVPGLEVSTLRLFIALAFFLFVLLLLAQHAAHRPKMAEAFDPNETQKGYAHICCTEMHVLHTTCFPNMHGCSVFQI